MPFPKTGRNGKPDYTFGSAGAGSLNIVTEDGKIKHLQLGVFEPPHFFERFLRGRNFHKVPDITAQVCDTCAAAHQMSAVHALEKALKVTVTLEIRTLRRLFYCAEWIQSHALHIYMLHAPHFMGFKNAIEMAGQPKLKPLVERGLRLKSIGSRLLTCIGGQEAHPISPCVGGFFRAPRHWELLELRNDLAWGLQAALDTVTWVNSLNYPDFTHDYEFMSLSHPDEYPLNEGRVISSEGLDIDMAEVEGYFAEKPPPGSQVAVSRCVGRENCHTGPLARLNLNHQKLLPEASSALSKTKLTFPVINPFYSITARAIELVQVLSESLQIVDTYKMPVPCRISVQPGAGYGCHITESPRGMLYHRYRLNNLGGVEDAQVWAPTAQNLKQIENDLHNFLPYVLELPLEEATSRCEQLVRNYNPCISCATNHSKVKIERR